MGILIWRCYLALVGDALVSIVFVRQEIITEHKKPLGIIKEKLKLKLDYKNIIRTNLARGNFKNLLFFTERCAHFRSDIILNMLFHPPYSPDLSPTNSCKHKAVL